MSAQNATLLAAIIAAIAAIGSLVANTLVASRRERRDAHRKALESELPDLADALHQVVATSFTQHKLRGLGRVEGAGNWQKRGKEASKKLEAVRPRVRYSLPGADVGLRNLGRLPDWTAHHSGGADGGILLAHADQLASSLHKLIEESWRSGNPPSNNVRSLVARLSEELRECSNTQPSEEGSDASTEME